MIERILTMENIKKEISAPEELLVIDDLETLKVVSDSMRLQVLELMVLEPRTVKEVAKKLEVSPNKLYYHINLLEKHGLIRVVDTKLVSGIVEKHYQVTARDIRLADGLISVSETGGADQAQALITTILDSTKEEFLRTLKQHAQNPVSAPDKRGLILKEVARMTDDQAVAFNERLTDLVAEFANPELDEPQAHTYMVMAMMYPTSRRNVESDHE
jgi:DNA-binding transcriptional ArsR family regulator